MASHKYATYIDRHLDVRLRADDGEWVAICPFHADTNPSFSINVDSGLWICFSCGVKGNIAKLQRHFGGQPLEVSLETLHRSLDRLEPAEEVKRRPASWLAQYPMSIEGRAWCYGRRIDGESIDRWTLGFDHDQEAVTIPLHALDGSVLGVIRRFLDPRAVPKYRYPPGFKISRYLFGAHRLVGPKRYGTIVVTEGSLDAIRVDGAGYAAVAVLGSSLSTAQMRLLRVLNPHGLVLAFDDDKAGRAALRRSSGQLKGMPLYVPTDYSGCKDPGEMTDDQIERLVASAVPYLDWVGLS